MKQKILSVLGIALGAILFASCNEKKVETGDVKVIHETKFNSSYMELQNEDLTDLGFSFGDSCNVYYSNGKEILDVPYYDGYYTRSDFPLICGYQGYPYVQITINNSSDFWDQYELSENDTVKVTLNEKGKYLDAQEAFSMHYYNEREKYTSDEEFANFRMVSTTNIKSDRLYRGASPFNDNYNRAHYVDKLLKDHSAKFILDLSDSAADLENYETTYDLSNSYALTQNKVLLSMGSNFRLTATDSNGEELLGQDYLTTFENSTFKESLVSGLNEMINSEGPFYVHCVEGKDRTGFVCMLLEALCGANYSEMKNDYMITYTNYFGLKAGDAKYDAVVNLRFDEFCEYLSGQTTGLDTYNYVARAKEYLKAGKMSDENIEKLIDKLTK